jgi:hypothetical protein
MSTSTTKREIIIKKPKEKELLKEEIGLLFTIDKRRNFN